MYNNDYLEKILGEQYNMSNYFESSYTEPDSNVLETELDSINDVKKVAKNTTGEELKKEYSNDEKKSNKQTEIPNTANNEEINIDTKMDQTKNNEKKEPQQFDEEKKQFEVVKVNSKIDVAENYNLNQLYPETYNVLEPIVELVVRNHSEEEVNENLIKNLTDKIYYAVDTTNNNDIIPVNKNNSKKKKNDLLYDLIKILIINSIRESKHKCCHNKKPKMLQDSQRIKEKLIPSYNDIPFPEDEEQL